ncbi:MAG TPA: DUF5655 domain-containing protein [Candidatus Angelobacter sp.]|jgi:hypothetical protein
MAKTAAKDSYDVHPSLAMFQKTLDGLKEKTGRNLEEWIRFVDKEGPATEKERREWLKSKHGLGTNYAWWIAERSVGKGDDGSPETYLQQAEEHVEQMYSGAKEPLRPIYDKLLELGRSMGKDVKVCPCQTMVPFYRKHVFAQIKPTTRTRIDLGLALKDTKAPKRLIDTGGFAKKDRITHRIEITSVKDIDAEVKKWLKTAYEMDR